MLDSALPPCFPVNNSGVSWLIPILHSNRTFRFTSNSIQFFFNSPRPHPTEHRGILTTPTQQFQEDFSIHLQHYSIFEHFTPFFNPSEHRGILTTPTQQFRSIFGLVSPLSLRRGSISNLRSIYFFFIFIFFYFHGFSGFIFCKFDCSWHFFTSSDRVPLGGLGARGPRFVD